MRSSFCGEGGCVEVLVTGEDLVMVRDGKELPGSPVLKFSDDEWSKFVAGVKAGEFDVDYAALRTA